MEKSIFLQFQVVYLQLQKYLILCIKNSNDENKKQELRKLINEVGQIYLKVKQKFEELEVKEPDFDLELKGKKERQEEKYQEKDINKNYEIEEAEMEPINEDELF